MSDMNIATFWLSEEGSYQGWQLLYPMQGTQGQAMPLPLTLDQTPRICTLEKKQNDASHHRAIAQRKAKISIDTRCGRITCRKR